METASTEVQAAASAAADVINDAVETLASDPVTFWSQLKDYFLTSIAPKLVLIVIICLVGLFLIRLIMAFLKKLFERSKLDSSLHVFTLSMIRIALFILLGITVLAVASPSAATGLIATMGIFGLAISLAVKDSLSNLAGGLSVLFTRPFALGDYVTIGSAEGTVKEIRLNYTLLATVDNKIIHIPNGDVAKAQITNFTGVEKRRLDLKFSIGYQDDFERAEAIISEILKKNPKALQEPEPVVRMVEHGSSAIVLCCRVWVNTEDYWPLNFDLHEQVKKEFDNAGISIPYNQLDVNLVGVRQ